MIKKGSGEKAILMLHGRGGDAENILTLAENFKASCYGFSAPGNRWYPFPFNQKKEVNEPYLSKSLGVLHEKILELKKSHEEIYLLGFSQGACLALEYASKNQVNGVIAFSGGLIGEDYELEVKTRNDVFIGCSENDPFIPLDRAVKSAELFKEKGGRVLTLFYPGDTHFITDEEIKLANKIISGIDI